MCRELRVFYVNKVAEGDDFFVLILPEELDVDNCLRAVNRSHCGNGFINRETNGIIPRYQTFEDWFFGQHRLFCHKYLNL